MNKLDKWLAMKITPKLLWTTTAVSTLVVLLGDGIERAIITLLGMSMLTFGYGHFIGYDDQSRMLDTEKEGVQNFV
jgi:hypothetical protein